MPEDKQDKHDEDVYEQWREVMTYDADSLRAEALFLNKHKKNREFMKQASADVGRNARSMARAVDYFRGYFDNVTPDTILAADDYLKLFSYASLNHELATDCFAKYGFDYPLYVIRERVAAAKPKRERKASDWEQVAELVTFQRSVGGYKGGDRIFNIIETLAAIKSVAKVLKNGDA